MQSVLIKSSLIAALAMVALSGCQQRKKEDRAGLTLTKTEVRSARRAFDGSPPVVPHEPQGAACITCHTATGKEVPNMAFAPANPHGDVGNLKNCRQCHVFKADETTFAKNAFEGLAVDLTLGDRLFSIAPPTIPHSLLMRENCLACHSGPSARPEIRCTHPERTNCRQCHVESAGDVVVFKPN